MGAQASLLAASSDKEPAPGVVEVFAYLTLADQAHVLATCRSMAALQRWAGWRRLRCQTAAAQFGLFCPDKLLGETWDALFRDLWQRRRLWSGEPAPELELAERVRVFARIKPLGAAPQDARARHDKGDGEDGEDGEEEEGEKEDAGAIKLPLHQRVALLKAAGKDVTSAQALKLLRENGELFPQQPDEHAKDGQGAAKQAAEEDQGAGPTGGSGNFRFAIHAADAASGDIVVAAPNIGLRAFGFNGLFPADSTQRAVFESVGQQLVVDVLNGVSGTLFVYGQTGSGKTHTMFGPEGGYQHDTGLIPRVCHELLGNIRGGGEVHASYVEIYGPTVRDLLENELVEPAASAHERVLAGHVAVPIASDRDVQQLLERGAANKTTAATEMNDKSSRAHTLLLLAVTQRRGGRQVSSQLILGDLGGSERLSKSKATGRAKQEAAQINLGLLSLKQVISALNDGRHASYNSSRLTQLLKPGLGGTSRTRVVVCVSQDPSHATETLQALRFGEDCSAIKSSVASSSSTQVVVGMVKRLDEQIAALEAAIREKERWETVEVRRADALVEEGTLEEKVNQLGGEVVRTTRMVGAEREHEELERLHAQRRHLLGL